MDQCAQARTVMAKKRKLRISRVKIFTGNWQYVPDTKERNLSVDIKNVEPNDGCESGLSKQRVSLGDWVEDPVRSWTMLYLGNKTFYWFSDVDLKKFSSAKNSWLVEDGYQLCISDCKIGGLRITPLTRIFSVGGLVPQIFMFSRRRRGLKKSLRNTQWNPPSPCLKFACKMCIFLHFLQGIQTQKRLRATGVDREKRNSWRSSSGNATELSRKKWGQRNKKTGLDVGVVVWSTEGASYNELMVATLSWLY